MEAIREGMEDYSYIKRLKELISKAPRDKAAAASVVLESAYISVLDSADLTFVAPDRPKYYIYKWHTGKRRSNTDVARKKILEAIEGF